MGTPITNISIGSDAVTITYDNGSKWNYVFKEVIDPPAPAPVPTPVLSTIIRGGYFDGVPDAVADKYADEFGMKYVRIWHTVKWTEGLGKDHPTFVRCRALQALGLKTLVVMTPPEKVGAPPANSGDAYTYFKNAATSAQGAVNAWEVWNEPNLVNYNASYPASASFWIRNGLMPAYQALKEQNQFVVSGGWSEGPNNGLDFAIRSGILKFCDAFGYHPYGKDAAEQISRVSTVRMMIGDKPMWLTEWNLHGGATWADELIAAAVGIKPYVNAVIHFRMVRTTQAAGAAAPYYDDGGTLMQSAGFHDKLIAAMKVFA